MDRILVRQLQLEVDQQCQYAMIAFADMDEASANSDGRLFWYSVQNLLVAVGRISRLLWPGDSLYPKRGAELRASLGVGEDSPLKALELVEHFEHFDRRLETWRMNSEEHRLFDCYTEPLDVLSRTAPEDRLRGFDTDRNAVLFNGKPYELKPIERAIEDLQRRAEEEGRKPRFQPNV